jgi:hypothetical protein
MKRRTEHLVEKRDGRREFLRATKLARSVHLALYEIGVDEDWRALELASVVLEALRQKRQSVAARNVGAQNVGAGIGATSGSAGAGVVLTTAEIADSVQHLLVVTGQPTAAVAYGAVQAERARRRQLAGLGVVSNASSVAANRDSRIIRSADRDHNVSGDQISGDGIAKAAPRTPRKQPNQPHADRFGGVWGEG